MYQPTDDYFKFGHRRYCTVLNRPNNKPRLHNTIEMTYSIRHSPKYVNIYRSISKLSYIDRYMISNIDRYIKFSKNHFSTDICRKFSFFDRYMKFFIFPNIIIFGFYSLIGSIKTSYIGHYNNAYIGLYENVYKTLGDLAYIDLYTPYRFAA